ncbi:MAG: hypothetical protein CMM47_05110 [Rhodospirillaceae bacterium]|nr:hypothetical protein [Rhodospirillaceae bacterium]
MLALAALSLALAACDTPNPGVEFPDLTFTHKPPIQLAVGKVRIINEYKMPFKTPNVEHLAPVAPGAAGERWAADIVEPVGRELTALFVITQAAITEEKLKIKTGVQGLFSIDQSERYITELEARIDIFDGSKRLGTARALASRSQTAREDTTPNQRAKLLYALVERLMADFDDEMRRQVETHLTDFLR